MAPAHVAVTRSPLSNFSRPTTAHNESPAQSLQRPDAWHHPPPSRGISATKTSQAPESHVNTPTTALPHGVNENPNIAGRLGKVQSAIYILLIITGLIGIGCAAYLLSSLSRWPTATYNPVVPWEIWPSLVTSSVSILWCSICLFLFLFLHQARPITIHSGVQVSIHLILWLGLVFTALLALQASRYIMRFGHDGQVTEYTSLEGYTSSSLGNYGLAQNGTWVWQLDTRRSQEALEESRTCQGSGYPSIPAPSEHPEYDAALRANVAACAEQDAGVNDLWSVKTMRTGVSFVMMVCQFIALAGHFWLFVRACAETKKLRRGEKAGRSKDIIEESGMPICETKATGKEGVAAASRYA
ncbi:hypothetical protein NX059_000990 [Plenodomus lindquistii]|nr:hypothetical protein NX059_000990 [Plenodomus lindquistii]